MTHRPIGLRFVEYEVGVRSSATTNASRKAMAWRGNLSKNIKELRFLLCQSSPASSSARAFVEKNYKELKTLNPKLPILIRECRGVEPQLWARYDLGVEKGIKLEGMTEPQISKCDFWSFQG
ncbi:NADH dehydrogenase [ubiquinone] 1 alpha subcomplex subunit [Trifolium repens]|nr:NADH dehydrogenase [ubiquinone] 1 alpha subcomplex subunit [Trifolium repens]